MKKLYVSFYLMIAFSAQAFAAEMAMEADDAHHGGTEAAHGAVEHHASGGLPQLDPSTFASQTFWLVLVVGFLYLFFSQKSLPEIAQVIENRNDRIQNDLDTAQGLKDQVAEVQKSYEASLTQSRNEAAALFKKMEGDLKSKSELEIKLFQEKSATQISELEKNILRSRDAAMDKMNTVASEIAASAAEKIIGVKPDMNEVEKVVQSLHKTTKTAKAA